MSQLQPTAASTDTHFIYEVGADRAEVKLVDDGWAWRCWTCGWHGVGLSSFGGAHRELSEHECTPHGDHRAADVRLDRKGARP